MNSILILLPTLFIILLSFAAMAFLGVWTYRDARARGLNAVMWVLVVLLAPSLIGLIIYLAVGRNQSTALCANCGGGLSANDQFCPKCGAAARGEGVDAGRAPRPIAKGGHRGPLIGFIVCLGLTVLLGMAILASAVLAPLLYFGQTGSVREFREYVADENVSAPKGIIERVAESMQDENLSIGVIENKFNNEWSIRFAVLAGQHNAELSFAQGQQLVVNSQKASGSLHLIVSDPAGERNEMHELTGGVQRFTLEGFEPGQIKVTLMAEAKDGQISITVR